MELLIIFLVGLIWWLAAHTAQAANQKRTLQEMQTQPAQAFVSGCGRDFAILFIALVSLAALVLLGLAAGSGQWG